MRKIDYIIIHCSATKEGIDWKAKDIDQWHKQRGFNKIGYHYVIDLDGTVETGRDENETGAHCVGYNKSSIGICYIGGLDRNLNPKDTRTDKQKEALWNLVIKLLAKYPNANVYGHNEFAKKACPCFNVEKEFENVNLRK